MENRDTVLLRPSRTLAKILPQATMARRHHGGFTSDPTEDRIDYRGAIAPTSDWNTLNPSVPPSSGSAARSGWGIMPRTLPPGPQIPAMLSSDPFGFASEVIWPSGVE